MTLKVTLEQDGELIKEFLRANHISERALRKLKNKGKILCNGQEVTWRKEVKAGDNIVLVYPEVERSIYIKPEPIRLNILFEDQDFVIIDKPPGICVHPTLSHPEGTVANGLIYHWSCLHDNASFHPVNRLDQLTSGLVIVAKNSYCAQQLFLQRENKVINRSYIALVHGIIVNISGIVEQFIERCEGRTTRRKISNSGQKALTRFEVILKLNEYTLISLTPETGRTHQIRVHMAHLGHPLVGDKMYGGSTSKINRQCLHANKIEFLHPRKGTPMFFEVPLPDDINNLLIKVAKD